MKNGELAWWKDNFIYFQCCLLLLFVSIVYVQHIRRIFFAISLSNPKIDSSLVLGKCSPLHSNSHLRHTASLFVSFRFASTGQWNISISIIFLLLHLIELFRGFLCVYSSTHIELSENKRWRDVQYGSPRWKSCCSLCLSHVADSMRNTFQHLMPWGFICYGKGSINSFK